VVIISAGEVGWEWSINFYQSYCFLVVVCWWPDIRFSFILVLLYH
jgi:cyanate permease